MTDMINQSMSSDVLSLKESIAVIDLLDLTLSLMLLQSCWMNLAGPTDLDLWNDTSFLSFFLLILNLHFSDHISTSSSRRLFDVAVFVHVPACLV
jgi:hypothetical protein